jgi:hypothetical protein
LGGDHIATCGAVIRCGRSDRAVVPLRTRDAVLHRLRPHGIAVRPLGARRRLGCVVDTVVAGRAVLQVDIRILGVLQELELGGEQLLEGGVVPVRVRKVNGGIHHRPIQQKARCRRQSPGIRPPVGRALRAHRQRRALRRSIHLQLERMETPSCLVGGDPHVPPAPSAVERDVVAL